MRAIVITGGPCAGKTSAIETLRARSATWRVPATFVSEAATDLIMAGIAPWTCDSMRSFQTQVIAEQLERENGAFARARAQAPDALVVLDRGICDSRAYLDAHDYACALAANGLDAGAALARYHAVFHLESVATSNPTAYTRANNPARFETATQAAAADERVRAAWNAHPHVHVIASQPRFEDKVDLLAEAIAAECGLLPSPG